MKSFLVSWYASGYCGTFRYMVVANNLDEAKEIWSKFVEGNKDVEYSWRKAEKGVKNHYVAISHGKIRETVIKK